MSPTNRKYLPPSNLANILKLQARGIPDRLAKKQPKETTPLVNYQAPPIVKLGAYPRADKIRAWRGL